MPRLVVGIGRPDQVVLPDRPLYAQLPLGDVGPEAAIGLVDLTEGTPVEGNRQLGRRDLEGGVRPETSTLSVTGTKATTSPRSSSDNSLAYSAPLGPEGATPVERSWA